MPQNRARDGAELELYIPYIIIIPTHVLSFREHSTGTGAHWASGAPQCLPMVGGGVFCVLLMVGRYCRRLPSSRPGLQLHRQDNHQETVTVSVLGDTTVTVCNNDMLVKTINIC